MIDVNWTKHDNILIIRQADKFDIVNIGGLNLNLVRLIETPAINIVNIRNYRDENWNKIIIDPIFKDYQWPFPKHKDIIIYDDARIT